ncbi:MAG: 2-oxoacid:acceptor oxidoreductase subunit alpha [Thermoplasmata archaeon]|nr:2-oxoacid:acceptor oxidoreductase subunit alpha [Thermoplasmata archaeon]
MKAVLTGRHFMLGDIACAEGALAAGCDFFGGYPITPATETAERMALRLPQVGGHYIQMEDEIASLAAVLGASCAGAKSMTATSGPGFSLMQENIGLGIVTETPCVIVNVQRGGPSTGLPTLAGQADMMQAQWGSHGDYEAIAYVPNSCQEMFDLTIKAFNAAERYRQPVFVMADEIIGHMTERVVIPGPKKIKLVSRKRPKRKKNYLPFKPDKDLIPPMALAGEGYAIHVTGLTHDSRGYPVIDEETQHEMVTRLIEKIRRHAPEIWEFEEVMTEDADIVVVSYGAASRSAGRAVNIARKDGIKAGLMRLITVWPFPEKRIKELAESAKVFVVPEINMGQISREVERFASGRVLSVTHAGGGMLSPEAVLQKIKEVTK